ncbi:ribosome assembly cofactor RimP [Allomuricauda sp. d1]|uniref:ribosome assembly cofactor RimP n=1 Tax=Allomuricauda sp. d1 TaxID=3136725 RepID=UPI0031D04707
MLGDKVTELLKKALEQRPSLFLIDLSITNDHKIKVVLDGDNGVTLEDCIAVSRGIEHELDRDEHDFSLEVTSAGAIAPLQLPRQYRKNIGRKLKVKTKEGEFEGSLTEADEEHIVLEWKAREPKPVGKGKHTVQKRQEIAFSDIEEAKVVLKF